MKTNSQRHLNFFSKFLHLVFVYNTFSKWFYGWTFHFLELFLKISFLCGVICETLFWSPSMLYVWKPYCLLQTIWLPLSSPSRKKHMLSPGFKPGSSRPQSKSDDLDRWAMGPALCSIFLYTQCSYTVFEVK